MYYTEEVEEGVKPTQALEVDVDVDEVVVNPDTDDDEVVVNPDTDDDTNQVADDEAEQPIEQEDPDNNTKPSDNLIYGTTRSGTHFRDIAAVNLAQFPLELTKAERNYYEYMKACNEIACVGAGVGGGFANTTELHVMKYDQAMQSQDAEQWNKAIEDEHNRMEENNVWTPVAKSEVPHFVYVGHEEKVERHFQSAPQWSWIRTSPRHSL
jgi:hypothetical protein